MPLPFCKQLGLWSLCLTPCLTAYSHASPQVYLDNYHHMIQTFEMVIALCAVGVPCSAHLQRIQWAVALPQHLAHAHVFAQAGLVQDEILMMLAECVAAFSAHGTPTCQTSQSSCFGHDLGTH